MVNHILQIEIITKLSIIQKHAITYNKQAQNNNETCLSLIRENKQYIIVLQNDTFYLPTKRKYTKNLID